MKEAYPVLIKQCGKDYLVYVPDLELYTEGKSMAEAMEMARDAIGLKGIDYIKDSKPLPEPSNTTKVLQKAKEEECVVDATQGRRTRAVIITNAGYIVLSALQPDTLTGRFNEISGNKLSEE